MFENIMRFFKKAIQDEDSKLIGNSSINSASISDSKLKSSAGTSSNSKNNIATSSHSKSKAKERLHLVLMQDRVNVSADFLDLMKKEIIEVIKKYIDIDEAAMDVSLTNKENEDGTKGIPALYANIPILNIKDETRKIGNKKEFKKVKENPPKNEEKIKENIMKIDEKKDDKPNGEKKVKVEIKKEKTIDKVEEIEKDNKKIEEGQEAV